MGIAELLLLAVGLSMDACAVSICKGLATSKIKLRHIISVGVWFGGFQALMPLIGYFLGTTFDSYITSCDHWIAFVLLSFIGGKMIKESFERGEGNADNSFDIKTMFIMAVATSIDALAVGVTFALLPDVDIWFSIISIGITTFIFSALGLVVGNIFGARYKSKAEFTGGLILIILGIKILIEHLFF